MNRLQNIFELRSLLLRKQLLLINGRQVIEANRSLSLRIVLVRGIQVKQPVQVFAPLRVFVQRSLALEILGANVAPVGWGWCF